MKHREKNREKRKFRIKHPLRYVVIALCIALFVLANMIIIFGFSAESSEESGNRSSRVTDFVLRIVYPHYDELPYVDRLYAQDNAHRIVRKTAHFLEYALLGFLSASLMLFLKRYLYKRKIDAWKTWFYPAEFCFLYAVSDEVHQIFSERGSSAVDVLIDTAGALFGIVLIQLIVLIFRRIRNPKVGKKGKSKTARKLAVEAENTTKESAETSEAEAKKPEESAQAPVEETNGSADCRPLAEGEGETPCEQPTTD